MIWTYAIACFRRCRVTQQGLVGQLSAPRGRPRSTSRRELQRIAVRLFTKRGFDNTTIEQIAIEAGVSERTFFRYFATKASVLWTDFETELDTIRAALATVGDDVPMMDAVRADNDLTVYLDAALTALAAGFAPSAIPAVG